MPRWTRWLLGSVAIVVLLLSASLVVLRQSDRALHAKIERLGDEGFAVTLVDFLGPPAPDAVAAGLELQAAWTKLRAGRSNPDPEGSGISGTWSVYQYDEWRESELPERRQALVDWLEWQRPFFDRVSDAVARPAIQVPGVVDEFGMADSEDLGLIERIAAALQARARAAPDPHDRMVACRDLIRLGRRLRGPITDGRFGSVQEWLGITALRDGVTHGGLDARLATELLGADLVVPPVDMAHQARRRVARIAGYWSAVQQGWRPKMPDGTPISWSEWDRLGDEADRLFQGDSLHGCGGHVTSNASTAAARLGLYASLARDPERWPAIGDPPLPDVDRTFIAREAAEQREYLRQHAATAALARVALAVKAHFDATGQWPTALDVLADALGGAVPNDSCGGASFVYEVGAAEVRLESVGRASTNGPLDDEDRIEFGLIWVFPATEDALDDGLAPHDRRDR